MSVSEIPDCHPVNENIRSVPKEACLLSNLSSTHIFIVLTGNVKLFKEPDLMWNVKLGDPLLLPTAYKDVASADSGLDEDTDELFR